MRQINFKSILALAVFALALPRESSAQLYIESGATFHIESGATVTVDDMDVISNANITGAGTLSMRGTATPRNLNMNGNSLPILDVANPANINLASNATINNNLNFSTGKLVAGSNNLTLGSSAGTSGANATNYVLTAGTGVVNKNVSSNLSSFVIPVGTTNNYNPLSISTSGTYSGANVSARAVAGTHPNKPSLSSDYTDVYWPITQTGITGSLTASGTYVDPTNVVAGNEANLQGMVWNGADWDNSGSANNNTATNQNGSIIVGNGDLYAQNGFVMVKAKMFLAGPFVSATTTMNDNLRTLAAFPTSTPYGLAPYTNFTQVSNTITETINPSILSTTGNNAIVDWVFLELRDNSGVNPGATVKYTRSVLVQKDGDIVDLDGVSPVYFRGAPAGLNYTLAVRHRNHLGLATDPVANLQAFSAKVNPSTVDFSTMTDAQIFGTATAFRTIGATKTLLAGDANTNRAIRYNGAGTDRTTILSAVPTINTPLSNVYHRADLNLNGAVLYNGANNDRLILLSNVPSATVNVPEQLPN